MTDRVETAKWDRLWLNTGIATMRPGPVPYGAIHDGAIAAKDGLIAWIGPRAELPGAPETLARETTDLGGAWMTPGLIDAHTHLAFAGDRSTEFEQRLNGVSYEEIARAGGGILSTVNATRAIPEEELTDLVMARLKRLFAEGVTTVEIKSGYGLTLEAERKQLRAARKAANTLPVRIRTTFLGAHALPPEFTGRQAAYIEHVASDMLPALAAEGLVDAVDGFCEGIAFTPEEIRRVFTATQTLGLSVKLHADQLSNLGGAALAASFNALSADHLEWTDEAGVIAMAQAGTVAMLLPAAFYFLRETRLPPIDLLRRHGVAMALASDANPGTAPTLSPLTILNMACVLFRLTPEEALAGFTREAAKALGLGDEIGTLEVGKQADLAIWNIAHPGELAYWIGGTPACLRVFHGGEKQEEDSGTDR
ncbi:MAG: imidazolonepropionase [Parvibaculaceae bacterium]|nr:imidazolonepropionase [Parvibaculaceae bacterium]